MGEGASPEHVGRGDKRRGVHSVLRVGLRSRGEVPLSGGGTVPLQAGQHPKAHFGLAEAAGNNELGGQIAPYFAVGQVIFLLLFVAYFVIVIPTSMGFVLGLVKTGLGMIEALKDVKYDI